MKTSSLQRIHSVDALRGFALAGIFFAHFVGQFMAAFTPPEIKSVMVQGTIDTWVDNFVFWFFTGKFFALFSFLFGLSFFIQMDRAAKKGVSYKLRFLWRLIILFGLGTIHQLFFNGDILTIYAVIGLCLIPFHSVSNKVVLVVAGFFFLSGGRFIVYALFDGEPILALPILKEIGPKYFPALQQGTLFDVWEINLIKLAEKFNFQTGVIARAYITFAYFLLGMWVGRTRMLEDLESQTKKLKSIMAWSAFGALIMIPLFWYFFSQMDSIFNFTSWWSMFAISFYDLFNLFFTIFIATCFIYLFGRTNWQKKLNYFSPYGRMALSNYFLQTLIGTFILYNWGLGYLGKLRNIETFTIAIVIITLQIIMSNYWLQKFKYGPLEWLWRSLTYFKWQPFIQEPVVEEDLA